MDQALKDLIKISHATGKDATLVQGGGGNTSVKTADGNYMLVKASGTALAEMNARQGWRRLSLVSLRNMINDTHLARMDSPAREEEVVRQLLSCCDDDMPEGTRPSVESLLHAVLDRCVIHLHPQVIGAYVNAKKGQAALKRLFAREKVPPLWVPYVDPGYSLARKMAGLVAQYQQEHHCLPAIMFLEKHGLFVAAPTAGVALQLVHLVIRRCDSFLSAVRTVRIKPVTQDEIRSAQLILRQAILAVTGQYRPIRHYLNETIAAFMARKDAKRLLSTGPLTPDELVYAHGAALWLDRCDSRLVLRQLQARMARGQKIPAAFLIKGLGLFVAIEEKAIPTVESVASCTMFSRAGASRLGGVTTLTRRQQEFINHWEAETYRRQLLAAGGVGELKDRIAIVSGGGSGLGRSLALGLARAGAMVAVFDIDDPAAAETVSLIREELPQGSAFSFRIDVTDENSVAEAFEVLQKRWGGLDILVNAAGVAPADPLIEFPLAQWRFALDVNLTGYFLLTRAAARLLIRQGMGGNIINLSSKSGLDASKNNSAYNVTKAGELHLARGWAMELGEFGIRVNCVCPGNVFEGSKIWNPEYIKVCAKKYGIRPDEVIPYYVNKTILRRQIKGQDIADAVVFLCSDRARTITGQIIVADSGQVMVR